MQLGIMAKTFVRPTLEGVLDAVSHHGFGCAQFNLTCAGLEPMPLRLPPELADTVRRACQARNICLSAVSGTFNMIHPDPAHRRNGLERLRVLAAACSGLGTPLITLCTGTRDAVNMWRRHPDNGTPTAWDDLLASMRTALEIAEDHQVLLGVEPEVSNVVDSAVKARRLLDELGSPRLKIVMDGANLFHVGELSRMQDVLQEAFALLGRDIALAHAKDLSQDGDAGHEAAGTGRLDYDRYLACLAGAGFSGALILHSLTEEQVPASAAFLRNKLAELQTP
jgi:sugar phosphate isomerase/epimerase